MPFYVALRSSSISSLRQLRELLCARAASIRRSLALASPFPHSRNEMSRSARNLLEQFVLAAGLRQEIVGPAFRDRSPVFVHGAGSKSDDRRLLSPGSALIFRVASSPSITGICTSIRINRGFHSCPALNG